MKRILLTCEGCMRCVQTPIENLWCAPFIPNGFSCHECGMAVRMRIADGASAYSDASLKQKKAKDEV